MSDELLPYYNEELRFIRESGAAFARANPKIAGRLQLGTDSPPDPHVSRLIEAFAYLNSRVRHKLDDDFPEIAEALLGVLYPHYLAPVPAAAIVQFTLDRGQAQLTEGHVLERLTTRLETVDRIYGEPCRFRTCYPVHLWPISVTAASLKRPPFQLPAAQVDGEVAALLTIRLETFIPKISFSQMPIQRLRFYLAGQAPFNRQLYELLRTSTVGVIVATSAADPQPVVLAPRVVQPVGLASDEGLFEYSPRSFAGYRLLTDYFAFPEKFLFLDVELPAGSLRRVGSTLELYFCLSRERRDLEKSVNPQAFRLGCTPVVNLFRQPAEPIRLTHTRSEYRVVPDARRPRAHEVFSIDRVTAVSPNRETVEFHPFYSVRHTHEADGQQAYWHSVRRPAVPKPDDVDNGSEVFLSLVDLAFRPSAPADWILHVETTGLNRDLPARLCENGPPRLQSAEGGALFGISCLTSNMRTLRPVLGQGTRWKLVSHLALNHLSLTDHDKGADALRDILKLYDFDDSNETRRLIDGLTGISSRRVTGRVVERVNHRDATFFCRGQEVTLQFDEEKFTDGSMLLLASVLERFLGLYCSINSFVKTIAKTNQPDRVFYEWPPRAGETALL
jgi:type VI secretion system protein ImpG